MSLDELEKNLYRREQGDEKKKKEIKTQSQIQSSGKRIFFDRNSSLSPLWRSDFSDKTEIKPNSKPKWIKWLGFASLTAVLLAIFSAGFYFWKSFGPKGIDLKISVSEDKIIVGVPFKAQIDVSNLSGEILKNIKLSISLPDDLILLKNGNGGKVITKNIGDINPGEASREELELVPVSGKTSIRLLEVSASYEFGSIGSEFEVKKNKEIITDNSAISLDLETPQKVFSGEEFETLISYQNNSAIQISNASIEIFYPDIFTFKESSSKPSNKNNNVWLINPPSDTKDSFSITGGVIAPANSFFEIKAKVLMEIYGKEYIIEEKTASLSVEPSPLSLDIFLNEQKESKILPGDNLQYTLSYVNNTSLGLKDTIITAKLKGEMFNFSSLSGNAFFNSGNNTLTWNAANSSPLSLISPGGAGSVSFSIQLKNSYPISRLNDKNFTVKVSGQIESPTVPEGITSSKTVSLAELENKISGSVSIEALGYFRDAKSGFINSGVWPLKADFATEFTIHWIIKNYSTDVSNISVNAFLGPGVRWTGNVKTNTSESLEYNDRTQEISWNINKILATKGVVGDPIEAVFQVEATPSILFLGKGLPLLGKTSLKATDEFVGEDISATATEVLTNDLADPTVSKDEGVVK